MPGEKRFLILFLSLPILLSQVGCVALNIPSRRFHDPTDHGGLFGHWRRGDVGCVDGSCVANEHGFHACQSSAAGGFCLDGGPLEVDPFDPNLDVDGNPKPPEVPWPRFHPVPTRPVYGSQL